MIPPFEEWYNNLVSNEVWFETVSIQHKGKDLKEACRLVYGDYVSDPDRFPEDSQARRHVHYKLAKMPYAQVKPVTNYQAEKQADFHQNPLTDEERRRVDDLLNQYKQKIQQGFKPVVQMSRKEIEKYGAERLPKSTEYHLTAEEMAIQAREQRERIRACRIRVIKDRHPDLTDEEVEERLKQLES